MYSESDLESAIAAGAISPEAAEALRSHVAAQRATPAVDEENFRLLTGFNDIFVVIAITLLLTALGWLGSAEAPVLGPVLIAVASWGLAEFFTRKRRMALPSIVLLLTFVGGIVATILVILTSGMDHWPNGAWIDTLEPTTGIGIGLAVAIGATAHWFRFRVPITIAAGAVSFVFLLLSILLLAMPAAQDYFSWLCLAGGVALFTFAMYWDTADRARQTRRSDVAFWLHLAAAPMIAHPIFAQLGVFSDVIGATQAFAVILLYILFAGISLAIDRRALLVSSLAYVLYAISELFVAFGAIGINAALTALVIGSALLLLSAFWHNARRLVMAPLPRAWKDRLPALDRPAASAKAA